ncbi:MAG TPA: hypothetical protein VFT05_11845 [Burkholderiaceae bacterium]|nr:hypothetical protein [Burkholderiaceae bacterium]
MKTCSWHIAATLGLGVLAVPLALFGQDSLERARPFFPVIDQNYGSWQAGYLLALLVLGLVWAAAMRQKINHFQTCLHNLRTQRRIDEHRQLRARQAEEARLARAAARAEQTAPPLFRHNARSTKFDY